MKEDFHCLETPSRTETNQFHDGKNERTFVCYRFVAEILSFLPPYTGPLAKAPILPSFPHSPAKPPCLAARPHSHHHCSTSVLTPAAGGKGEEMLELQWEAILTAES